MANRKLKSEIWIGSAGFLFLALPLVFYSACGSGITDHLSSVFEATTPSSFFGCGFPPCPFPPSGSGVGTFATGVPLNSGTPVHRESALADLDGDGDLDVVVGNSTAASMVCIYNGASYVCSDLPAPSGGTASTCIALGDLDGDGDIDIIEGNAGTGEEISYLNNGSGTFSGGGLVSGDTTSTTLGMALGDLDEDGDLDLVVSNSSATIRMYEGNGDSSFKSGVDIDSTILSYRWVALGDLNGDHHLDLVAAVQTVADRVYLGNGDGTFQAAQSLSSDVFDSYGVVLGDLNSDGKLDAIVTSSNAATKDRVYIGKGDGTFQAGFDLSSDADISRGLAVGDLDDDGDLDVVVSVDGGSNRIYLNANSIGTSWSGADVESGVFENTFDVDLGDVDQDGVLDIVTTEGGGIDSRVHFGN